MLPSSTRAAPPPPLQDIQLPPCLSRNPSSSSSFGGSLPTFNSTGSSAASSTGVTPSQQLSLPPLHHQVSTTNVQKLQHVHSSSSTPQPPSQSQMHTTQSAGFWFTDGDIVLCVGSAVNPNTETRFRVHQSRLSDASASFAAFAANGWRLPDLSPQELAASLSRNPSVSPTPSARLNRALAPFLTNSHNTDQSTHSQPLPFSHPAGVVGPERTENGRPLVRLPFDSPRDWTVTLEAVYEPS